FCPVRSTWMIVFSRPALVAVHPVAKLEALRGGNMLLKLQTILLLLPLPILHAPDGRAGTSYAPISGAVPSYALLVSTPALSAGLLEVSVKLDDDTNWGSAGVGELPSQLQFLFHVLKFA